MIKAYEIFSMHAQKPISDSSSSDSLGTANNYQDLEDEVDDSDSRIFYHKLRKIFEEL